MVSMTYNISVDCTYYLFRMRTGSFTTAERLAQMRLVDPIFLLLRRQPAGNIFCAVVLVGPNNGENLFQATTLQLNEWTKVLLLGGEIRGCDPGWTNLHRWTYDASTSQRPTPSTWDKSDILIWTPIF